MVRMALMGGALLMAWPAAAQGPAQGPVPAWEDCTGRIIILGQYSRAEGAAFSHWATLSNPGMRPIRVQPGFGEAPPAAPVRIEAGRMERVRLGTGAAQLPAAEIEAAMRLRCQAVPTRP